MKQADYGIFNSPKRFAAHIKLMMSVIYAIYMMSSPKGETLRLSGGIKVQIVLNKKDSIGIRVVIGENIDYAGATEEVWINRPGNNPNEGWIRNARENCEIFIDGFFKDPNGAMKDLDDKVKNKMEEFPIRKEDIEVINE